MRLQGQHGYAMAALLVGMSIMAIMMTVAMPTWRQINQREKEAELVFRGEQYARAIGLYQRKMGPGTLPPTLDVLVEQRFVRKKFKDPITNDDFLPLAQTANAPSQAGGQGGAAYPGRGAQSGSGATGAQRGGGTGTATTSGGTGTPGAAFGGISGVTSKSKEASIRVYNGRTHYNEWEFRYQPPPQAAGANSGQGVPGVGGQGRGNPQGGPQGTNPFGVPGGPGGGRQGTPPGRGGPGFPGAPGGPQNPNGPGRGPGGGFGGAPFNPVQPPTRSGR